MFTGLIQGVGRLDGRSALASGDSKWISGEPARMDVQRWRARSGALLTGAGTVLVDELLLYVAPVMLGERARPLFEGLHIDAMTERLGMRIVETRRIGEDVRVLLRPLAA
jgi:diaminohydroxyphosphoribosylaminopyrimidine deaminase/5-amino-6-(5-phosphoribosylamino)uracil reductase